MIFQKNYELLKKKSSFLCAMIKSIPSESIGIAKAQDGGNCYAVQNAQKIWQPITEPNNPLETAKLAIMNSEQRLTVGYSPAVLIGLNVGYELDMIVAHFNSRLKYNEEFRRVYVIIDSPVHLVGWLNAQDRSEVLNNDAIEFYWHKRINNIVLECENDEQRSHYFIPVSSYSKEKVIKITTPLVQLYSNRKHKADKFIEENNAYYANIKDAELAEIIKGCGVRKPRLMMPTHLKSNVVQYSTRDTCKAFKDLDWDIEIIEIERELTPWRLVKRINEFKPDIVININHLRTEGKNIDCYPPNLMYLTWIQDEMSNVNNSETGEEWTKMAIQIDPNTKSERKRDLIIGYATNLVNFGYEKSRLKQLSMIVDTKQFKPIKLTVQDKKKYSCEICFASNRGKESNLAVKEDLLPVLSKFGFTEKYLFEIHDNLWKYYRDNNILRNSAEVGAYLSKDDKFLKIIKDLSLDDKNEINTTFQWQMNDIIYRHLVLEWCDELGVNMNLYGQNWEKHSKLAKYAKGEIKHGSELNKAYQSAKFALHLNSIEGNHQRLTEIISSGGTLLMRSSQKSQISAELASAFRKMLPVFYGNEKMPKFTDDEQSAVNDLIFIKSQNILTTQPNIELNKLEEEVQESIKQHLTQTIDWILPNWNNLLFNSKEELKQILGK